MELNFGVQFYPISVDQEDYNNGVNPELLDGYAYQLMGDIRKKITSAWLFGDIFLVAKDNRVFRTMADEIYAQHNLHLMSLIAIDILEPGVDYFDTELEKIYDHLHEKFVPHSKYMH